MKPTNTQANIEVQNKIENLYLEIMNCSKFSKKKGGHNYFSIKTKFWTLVNKLEKLLATAGPLDGTKRMRLNATKRKFK